MISTLHDRKQFKKKGFSPMKASRSRMETSILLRKVKKDELLKQRRAMKASTDTEWVIKNVPTDTTADADFSDDGETVKHINRSTIAGGKKYRLNPIDETVVIVMTRLRDTISQLHNTHASSIPFDLLADVVRDIRRLSGNQNDPPIGKLLAHGLLPYLSTLLRYIKHPIILYETIWCFINVSSSDDSSHVEAVATSGVVIDIANLLVHGNEGVCEQAIWFIANMAGANVIYRDELVGMTNVIDGLLYHVKYPANVSILSTCAWAISNLFRGQSSEMITTAKRFVPDLASKTMIGIKGHVPAAELVDLMNALFYISEFGQDGCALVLESGLLPILINALQYYSDLPEATILVLPVLRIIGQISSGTEQQTEQVIQSGFLDNALKLLKSSKKHIQHDVLLTLSNIAAGTHKQINSLLIQRPLIKGIVRLANDAPAEVKKEALWTLSNMVTEGSAKQLLILVNHDCIATFCNFLATPFDIKLVLVVLAAVERLLIQNKETELGFVSHFEYCNGVQIIEDLQSSKNETIYETATRLMVNYFDNIENEEFCDDQEMAPSVSDENKTFEFGLNPSLAKQLFPETVQMYNFGGNVQMNSGFIHGAPK